MNDFWIYRSLSFCFSASLNQLRLSQNWDCQILEKPQEQSKVSIFRNQSELEKKDRIDEMKKKNKKTKNKKKKNNNNNNNNNNNKTKQQKTKQKKNSSPVPHLLQTQRAHGLPYAKVVGRPALEATQHHRPTQPPPVLTGRKARRQVFLWRGSYRSGFLLACSVT